MNSRLQEEFAQWENKWKKFSKCSYYTHIIAARFDDIYKCSTMPVSAICNIQDTAREEKCPFAILVEHHGIPICTKMAYDAGLHKYKYKNTSSSLKRHTKKWINEHNL